MNINSSKNLNNNNNFSFDDYINIIIKNNIDEKFNVNFNFEKFVNKISKKILNDFICKIISIIYSKYKINNNNNNKNFVDFFLFLFMIIKEKKLENFNLNDFKFLLKKFFNSKLLKIEELNIIIKFIIFSSIFSFEEINDSNIENLKNLKNKNIKNYENFKFCIEIIIFINNVELNKLFVYFLEENVLKNKTNKFLLIKNFDIINLIYLTEENNNNFIILFLTQIFKFNFDRKFLSLFFNKLKEYFNQKYLKIKSIDVIKNLEKNIFFLQNLFQIEEKSFDEDSNIINKGFVFNNNELNGIEVKNVLLSKEFTIIFSFNFAPDNFDKKEEFERIRLEKDLKLKSLLLDSVFEYSLLYLYSENENNIDFGFYLKDNNFYLCTEFNKEKKICNIKNNLTYLVYFSFKEFNKFYLKISSDESNKIYEKIINNSFNKNLTLKIGNFNKNFEGFFGPVLIFNNFFEDNFIKNIFSLKGFYDEILFLNKYDLNHIEKYDKFCNYMPDDFDNKQKKYLNAIEYFKQIDLNKFIIAYISPNFIATKIKKTLINYLFNNEIKINFKIEPKIENFATFFFYNKNSIFEFIKFEGINYLIFNFELINRISEECENEQDKKTLIKYFSNLIDFTFNIFFLLNLDFYYKEIKALIFSIQKNIYKICNKFKISEDLMIILNKLIIVLNSQDPEFSQKKLNSYTIIRNDFINILLNIYLYNLTDYSTIEYFFVPLENCLNKNPEGLINEDYFQKILNFSQFFNTFDAENIHLKHQQNFKSLKNSYLKLLFTFLKKTEKISIHILLFKMLEQNNNVLNYQFYQLFKLFYLISDFFFNKIDEEFKINAIQFIINLYEKYKNVTNLNENCYINIKELNIIKAICLIIIFEFHLSEDFYFNKKKGKKIIFLKPKEQNEINNNNVFNLDKIEAISRNQSINIINKKKSSIENEYDILINSYYEDFNILFNKLINNPNLNDYSFKSILILLLSKNNEITLTKEEILNFIIKCKKSKDFINYNKILNISYLNKEYYSLFIKIGKIFEINKNVITSFSYEIMLFIFMKILKNQDENKCLFRHIVESKKFYGKIFKYMFIKNEESRNILILEFPKIIKYVLLYYRNSFIFYFLYEISLEINLQFYTNILLNQLLNIQFDKEKFSKNYYYNKINTLILFYYIINNPKIWENNNKLEFSYENLHFLFEKELIKYKFNIFKYDIIKLSNKEIIKTYVETLFDIINKLQTYKKAKNYEISIITIFVASIQDYKDEIVESRSILYYIDKFNFKKKYKNSTILKYFPKYSFVDIPSMSFYLLYKILKSIIKIKEKKVLNVYKSFLNSVFIDSKLIYNEFKESRNNAKHFKNKEYYNFIKDTIEFYEKNKISDYNKLIEDFNKKYSEIKSKKEKEKIKKTNKFDNNNNNFNNDSFSSCNSTKSLKNECQNNKKKKFYQFKDKNKIKTNSFQIENLKGENNITINNDINNKINLNTINNNEKEININNTINNNNNNNKINSVYNFFSNLLNYSSSNKNNNNNNNIFDLKSIENFNQVILFPKLNLIKQIFSIFFTDRIFYDKGFIMMKKYYKFLFENLNNLNQNINIDNYFNYPITLKNYTPKKIYYKHFFIKNNLDFFYDPLFIKTHEFYQEKIEICQRKRIFLKKSENDELARFFINLNENYNQFYVDLITNKYTIFGEIILTSSLFYFHSLDKKLFLSNLNEDEKKNWLFCSLEIDYSRKNKKIFILKKEINEIINRRFLYLFQACEIYLKNGKSYFFNFYSEENKIKFFNILENKEYNIKIISNLKEKFRLKNYTKNWKLGKIDNLNYLLFINKFASRSYNDCNQYPVLPWIVLLNNKKRDLKFPIPAQTEENKEILKIKYENSPLKFPCFYNTHFSNSSYVLYFLIRLNPFTNNQVLLQNGKFDAPNRQFNSFDECLNILKKTNDSRELIPDFFLSTECFKNYNCNYFGFRKNNDNLLINDLKFSNFNSPMEFIINNLNLINSDEIKNQINFFIDNVFGKNQVNKENFNIYDKYCYQELVNLREKLEKFKRNDEDYNTIKTKIDRKVNKILSFGQTPFKLFEEKHFQWINEKDEEKNNKIIEKEQFILFDEKIINFKISQFSNNLNKNFLYVLLNKNNFNYEIKYFSTNHLNEKEKSKIENFSKKIKFHHKLKFDNNNSQIFGYKFNTKFILIDFNLSIFILCRIEENSLLFLSNKTRKYFMLESYVTSLLKINEKKFISGHLNGKIMEWEIDNQNNKIIFIRSLLAHKEKIIGIYYDKYLNIIITNGEDENIFIRKYYDFEILTMIEIKGFFCIELKIYKSFLYILLYNIDIKKYIVKIYSLNGILLKNGEYDYINNIDISNEGYLLVGFYYKNIIKIFDTSYNNIIKKIILQPNNYLSNINNKNENLIENNSDVYFVNFIYDSNSCCVFCSFSNGLLLKKLIKI